ncbi:MAG: C10 family peptidase [Bacteroidaceae bacterium]|nr:C10 family peptidase [Bacteroidaceae bacterium]
MNNKFTFTRKLLTLLLALFCTSGIWAEDVTEEQALEQALDFLTNQTTAFGRPRKAQGVMPQLTMQSKVSGLYVFNVENNGGFVIVSNDDRTHPILGFSESGNLDVNNIPDNMKAWLQGYADEIAWLKSLNLPKGSVNKPANKVGTHSTAAVAPLCTSKWNQDTPYNNFCPTYTSWYGSGKCATGCVATAMAQVMYYHKWPQAQTASIPGYTTYTQGLTLPSLSPVTFDWANMKDSYSGNYTTAQANAVATLMKYCGYSVKMDYDESSGAYTEDVAIALREYFDYNVYTTRFVSRSSFTYANWTDMIYHEVSHGRPVCYGGLSTGGGHEFVCDGYKFESNTDFFHINWGWGGLSDNYFVLSALDPDHQGIGGSTSTDGFHYGQDAVIGIQKSTATGTVADIDPNENDLTLNSITLSDNPVGPNETVNIIFNVTNNGADDYDGDIWLALRQDDDDYLIDLESVIIPAGTTQDVVIPYTPTSTGTYTFLFCYINAEGQYVVSETTTATLTVAENLTNGVVPVYGYWVDNLTKSQFVIAEANIEDMAYSTITSMTFKASEASVNWGNAKFDVYLGGTTSNTISSLTNWGTLDKVYSGSLSVNDKEMTVTFDEPYYYEGGNLLVGFNQTATGNYVKVSWHGESVNGVSIGGYGSSVSQQNFLPDVKFEYTPGEAPALRRPRNVTIDYAGGTQATVSWTSDASAFDINVNGVITEDVSNPITLTGLEYATTYIIKVRAKEGEEVSDWSAEAQFTTEACTAPANVWTTEVGSTSATLAWDSGFSKYDLRYKPDTTPADFEEGLGLWTTIDADGDGHTWLWSSNNNGILGYASSNCAYSESYDKKGKKALTPDNWLVSPKVILGGSISFWAKGQDARFFSENFGVAVSTTGNTDPADFKMVSEGNVTTHDWTLYTIDLSDFSGEGYVAIRHYDVSDQFYLDIDDITITQPGQDWVEVDGVEATSYELRDLWSETAYIAEVRGYCDGADHPTDWSKAINFVTDKKYIIPNITLTKYEANTELIKAYSNKLCNVTLAGRSLHKDGYWNTICLPFDLQLEGSPLEGADLRAMSEAIIEENTITLNFTEEGELDAITAGTPYIIRWENGESLTEADLVFNNVIVRNTMNDFVGADGQIEFKGTYSPIVFTSENQNIRFMGSNSVLYYPLGGARIGAQHAYFQFTDINNLSKQFILNLGEGDDPTALQDLQDLKGSEDSWFDLEGRKLAGKPSRKGIYINEGKTVIIK